MQLADIFVGTIAALIGATAIAIAVANWGWGFQFWVGRVIDARVSRTASRVVYAIVGAALVALGIAIASGLELADYLDLRSFMQ